MLLIGKEAPDFTAAVVMPDNSIIDLFNLSRFIHNKKAVLFFYPLDFTFVCPSEIIALDNRAAEFEKRGVTVILISIDSHFTHLAYKNTPIEKGGIGQIKIPMIADLTKKIATEYGVLSNGGVAFRGTFIIDQHQIVRHQSINDLPLGRNIDEILRIIDALEHFEKHGEVCPANWKPGDNAITPTTSGIEDYLKQHSSKL